MSKVFEVVLNGVSANYVARANAGGEVSIYEQGSDKLCVVLTRSNVLDRALGSMVNNEELIDIAISQAVNNSLIFRAKDEGRVVHEALVFVPNEL